MNENELVQEEEISLRDMIMPLLDNWKLIAASAAFGAVISLGSWFSQGYQAELVANTRETLNITTQTGTLDFLTWRNLSSGLPSLANKLAQEMPSDPVTERLYKRLSQADWWRKNVTPVYMYSKSDIKELASISKEAMDAGSTTIERLQIRTTGFYKEDAISDAFKAELLIRQGAVYLALKALLNRYDLEVRQLPATLLPMMTKSEVELIYLKQKVEALEALRKSFPDQTGTTIQSVIDPKDSAAKYLPLSTQLVAAKTEINSTLEYLARSRDRLEQNAVFGNFLEKAMPLLDKESDGFALSKRLTEVEKQLRNGSDLSNKQKTLALNTIAGDIDSIDTRYRKLFEDQPLVSVHRPPLMLPAALGLIGGALLGILILFGRRALGSVPHDR